MTGLLIGGSVGFVVGVLVPKEKAKTWLRGILRKLNNKVKEV